jgi:hypothetical protein
VVRRFEFARMKVGDGWARGGRGVGAREGERESSRRVGEGVGEGGHGGGYRFMKLIK